MNKEISIMRTVLNHYNMTQKLLRSETRKGIESEARMIMHYLLKKYTKHVLSDIGLICGGFDHSMVIYSIKTINDRISTEKAFKEHLDLIESKIVFKKEREENRHTKLKRQLRVKRVKK